MKTFSTAKWDVDADHDTFQELFKKKGKNKSKLMRKAKDKLKRTKVNKKVYDKPNLKFDDTINLINTPPGKIEKNLKRKEQTAGSQSHKKLFVDLSKTIKSENMKNESSGILKKTQHNELEKLVGTSANRRRREKFLGKLKDVLLKDDAKEKKPRPSLRRRMMEKLEAARFRFINEQIYTSDSSGAQKLFRDDPGAFRAYHDGYSKQVRKWPMNPLDAIIESVRKMPKSRVVADFGCGEARLSKSVNQKVHSFDLVAVDGTVTECDMRKVPLGNNSVDVAVFCLSLMGTNLKDYLLEANRVLRIGGVLKIAEVESRFDDVDEFIEGANRFGFKNTAKDLTNNLFYFLDFVKDKEVKSKNKVPSVALHPCLYKKR